MNNTNEFYIGTLIVSVGGGFHIILLDDSDKEVRCYVSGKMKKNRISVLVGDRVEIWWDRRDVGRIIKRLKQ